MGKSATGKDTIYRKLMADKSLGLLPMVAATTRPMRVGEVNGRDYWFYTEEEFETLKATHPEKIIECREYSTVHGIWRYFTPAYDMDTDTKKYLYIGTLEAYTGLVRYYGEERVKPIYIYVRDDGERLLRALKREMRQEEPKYAELCRRYLGDEEDFSRENIDRAGIKAENMFENDDIRQTTERIAAWISG